MSNHLRLILRRMPLTVLLLLVIPFSNAPGQQSGQEPPTGPWTLNLDGSLTATRSSFSNWREGGVNSLGYSAGLRGEAVHEKVRWKQTHSLRLEFGQIKQEEMEIRKSTDVIQFGYVLQNLSGSVLSPTAALEFRTQFASGYDYKNNPFDDGREPPVKVSDFLAPAYLTESVGMSYEPDTWFSTRLGVGGKQTIVTIEELGALYGLDAGETVRLEVGLDSQTEVKLEIFENVFLESKLGLFTAFRNLEMPDTRWENFLTMKVNSWLNVNAEFTALYDGDVSTRMQYKQLTSIGVSVDIF